LQEPSLFPFGDGERMFFAPTADGWMPTNANGTLFYSLLLNAADITDLSTNGEYFCGFNNQPVTANPPTDFHARIYLRQNGAGFQVGISKNGGNPTNYDSTVHYTNETLFVVVEQQIVWNPANPSGTDDNVFLWINPPTNSFGACAPPTNAANASILAQDADESGPITSFIIANRSCATPDNLFIQNIRLATNWAFVTGAPGIKSPPANVTVSPGHSVHFSVTTVSNGSSAGYQWSNNGSPLADGGSISGSSTSKLTISGARWTNAGIYSVLVTNGYGSASAQAVLTVTVPPPQFVLNQPLTLLGDGTAQLNFSGTAGTSYHLWATTNLALPPAVSTWILLTNGVFSGGVDTFTGFPATNQQGFYTLTQP
jgi:hypothetical protein